MIFAKAAGLASLASQLGNVAKAAKVASAARSHDVADELVEGMKARVHVESGTLRDSIRAEPNDNGTVTVLAGGTPETARPTSDGTVYDEAVLTEFGTIHQSPAPFFWPEVDAAKERHGQEIFTAAAEAAGDA